MPLLLAFGAGIFGGLWVRSEVSSGPSLTTIAAAGAAGWVAWKVAKR